MDKPFVKSAHKIYLDNRELIDGVEFKDEKEAFEWIKENREKVKGRKGEELSLVYIAEVLNVAGKIRDEDLQKVEWMCGAYEIYLDNRELIDGVEFKDEKKAFEWIKENREKVKGRKGEELSLVYIAKMLNVAGKIRDEDLQKVQWMCSAYESYLDNKELIDKEEFKDEKEAFEWIKENREKVKGRKGEELSLVYIAAVLNVAGKIRDEDLQKVQRVCSAYDFFQAKKHLFWKYVQRFNSREEAIEGIRKLSEFDSPLIYSLKRDKNISKKYLRNVYSVIEGELKELLTARCVKRGLTAEERKEIERCYREAMEKIRKSKGRKHDKKKLERRKWRETCRVIGALRSGVELEERAYKKLRSRY